MRRFEFAVGRSGKFWQAEVRGDALVVEWGALGTAGRAQTKRFGDGKQAEAALERLIREKAGKR